MSQDKPTVVDHAAIQRLHAAGLELVGKLRSTLMLPNHQNGYLSVYTKWGLPICQIYLGLQIIPHDARSWGDGHEYCRVLYEKMNLNDGSTSSDINKHKAGAVLCGNIIICYLDRNGIFDKMTNEAMAIMIAAKAGLLTNNQIWHRYGNSEAATYNSWLHTMLELFGHPSDI